MARMEETEGSRRKRLPVSYSEAAAQEVSELRQVEMDGTLNKNQMAKLRQMLEQDNL